MPLRGQLLSAAPNQACSSKKPEWKRPRLQLSSMQGILLRRD
jgi:hypothetical protein